jgi:hypothetical protein
MRLTFEQMVDKALQWRDDLAVRKVLDQHLHILADGVVVLRIQNHRLGEALAVVLGTGCPTCRFREDAPRVSFRGEVYEGPFCGKAGRTERDDTPNDDDGLPIVVRCATLGHRCGAWEATDV